MQKKQKDAFRKLSFRKETLLELNPANLSFVRGGTGSGDPQSDVSNNCCDPDQTN